MKKLKQLAPSLNAYTVLYDAHLLDRLRKIFISTLSDELCEEMHPHLLTGNNKINFKISNQKLAFHVLSYGEAPLLWVSSNNIRTYNVFKSFLASLDIIDDLKELVDYKKHLRMYCGFFVVGNRMDRDTWHVDYKEGSNGYTLITPLFELDKSHGNLIYKDEHLNIQKYVYKMNEAIVFGDGFYHATEPYAQSNKLRVMLSVSIGTDKLEYWDLMKDTIGDQSDFIILPCGHQKGTCHCLAKY